MPDLILSKDQALEIYHVNEELKWLNNNLAGALRSVNKLPFYTKAIINPLIPHQLIHKLKIFIERNQIAFIKFESYAEEVQRQNIEFKFENASDPHNSEMLEFKQYLKELAELERQAETIVSIITRIRQVVTIPNQGHAIADHSEQFLQRVKSMEAKMHALIATQTKMNKPVL